MGEKRANLISDRITAPFRGAATALMLGSTIALSALPANAQDAAPVQTVSATVDNSAPIRTASIRLNNIQILDDANFPANKWVADKPGRIAVSVVIGPDAPENVVRNVDPIVTSLLAERGYDDVVFFYEIGDLGDAVGFKLHADKYVSDPILTGWKPQRVIDAFDDYVAKLNFDPITVVSSSQPLSGLN